MFVRLVKGSDTARGSLSALMRWIHSQISDKETLQPTDNIPSSWVFAVVDLRVIPPEAVVGSGPRMVQGYRHTGLAAAPRDDRNGTLVHVSQNSDRINAGGHELCRSVRAILRLVRRLAQKRGDRCDSDNAAGPADGP